MTNLKPAIIVLILFTLLLPACGGNTNGNTQANQPGATGSTSSDSANRFTITGHQELTASNVTMLAYSTDANFNRVAANPVYYFIQLIEGPLSDSSGTVNLFLSPDVQTGTYELLDSSLISPNVYTAGYVARIDQRNSFYMLTDPGTLTITQLDGGRISGSFEFTAYLAGSDSDADQIIVSGSFEDAYVGAR